MSDQYQSVEIIIYLVLAEVIPYWVTLCKNLYYSIRDINNEFYQTELFGY